MGLHLRWGLKPRAGVTRPRRHSWALDRVGVMRAPRLAVTRVHSTQVAGGGRSGCQVWGSCTLRGAGGNLGLTFFMTLWSLCTPACSGVPGHVTQTDLAKRHSGSAGLLLGRLSMCIGG